MTILEKIKQKFTRKIEFKEYYPASSNAPGCICANEIVSQYGNKVESLPSKIVSKGHFAPHLGKTLYF